MICKYILLTFLNKPELIFFSTQLNGFKYCYELQTVQLNSSHLSTQLNDQTVLFLTNQFSRSQQS